MRIYLKLMLEESSGSDYMRGRSLILKKGEIESASFLFPLYRPMAHYSNSLLATMIWVLL